MHIKILLGGEFPGGPVIKGLPSSAGDLDVTSGWGNGIPHAATKTLTQPKINN